MRQVFVDQDFTRVGYFRSVLEEAGIPTFIRNELSNNSLTEMPSPIFFPTLCVVNDDDYDEAMKLLSAIYYASGNTAPEWSCPACHESVPGNFDCCWNCGHDRSKPDGGS